MSDALPPTASVLDPLAVATEISASAPVSPDAPSRPPAPPAAPAPSAADGAVAPGTHDRRGVPYDPERHLPKMHSRHGGWMPRPRKGVRKARPGRATAPAPDVSTASTAPADPAASEAPPEPEAASAGAPPAPEPAPWTSEDRSSAAGSDGAAGAAGATAPQAEPGRPVDAEATPDALAEVVCNAVYTITGLFTGHMKEARPAGAEHAGIKKTVAAYLAARGWHAVGGLAVAATAAAYFIRVFQQEGSSGVLRAWWERRKAARAKPAEPTAAPQPAAPGAVSAPLTVVGDTSSAAFGL